MCGPDRQMGEVDQYRYVEANGALLFIVRNKVNIDASVELLVYSLYCRLLALSPQATFILGATRILEFLSCFIKSQNL